MVSKFAAKLVFLLVFALCTTYSFAQSKITGTVTAPDSKPLAGVSITVKGTSTGVSTGADGTFSLTVAAGSKTIVVSNSGYNEQQIDIAGQNNFTIVLQPRISDLNEVVIIGYGTSKRKDLTGAVSSISSATIDKIPVVSADQALQGRAAGVQITNNDGAPGGNISVLIRGIGSLASGGNRPLYVIDGYPTDGGINNINPNDIATIDVLKDASATAVYGIRAANGVVIITTKKGLKNKVQVSFDSYLSAQSRPKNYDLLNAQQFATLSNDVAATTPTYTGLPIWKTPEALTSVDWQDAIYRSGLTQNYSVGIRGGSDKVQSAVSFGYFDQKGVVLGSFFKRYTASLNMDYQPAKWLKSSTSVKFSNQNSNVPFGTGNLLSLVQLPPTLDSGNRLTNQIKDGNGNYGFYNPQNSSVFKYGNPVYDIETRQSKNINNYLLANTSLEVMLYDGLKVKTSFGINNTNFSGSYYSPEDLRAGVQYPGSITATANYHQNLNSNLNWIWENTIAYDKTFGKHTINFVGGVSAQKNTNNLMGAGGIPPNGVIRDLAQVSNLKFDQFGNGQYIESLASEFARVNYQYNDKYIITGTIRRDGSSKFDTGHQYGVFPSGAIAWKVINEPFMRNVSWLNDLKLRGSYGQVGNQAAIGLYQYQALYAGNFSANVNGGGADNLGYPFGKIYQNGLAQSQPANPDLKWETDVLSDIGVDASFMRGALSFTADVFRRDSRDFLLTLAAPAQTGYTYITRNVGSMRNEGIELALNYNGNRGKDFKYNVGLTYSSIKNTLTNIASGTNAVTNFGGLGLTGQGWSEFTQSVVGGKVGEFYGYKALGIFQNQGEIDALNAKAPGGIYYRTATKPGDRYFADINGDGLVNADDRTGLGNPQPKFFSGLNLDGNYKAWDVNLYFYAVVGNKLLNYVESSLESFQARGSESIENVSVNYFNNRWTPSNPSNRYARALNNDDNTLNNVPSSVWVEDGSFLKMKNLTVGYTFPNRIVDRFSLSKFRLYVSSQNLFTITKYSGLDPEIGIKGGNPTQNGVDNGNYPSSRFFTFGLNATF